MDGLTFIMHHSHVSAQLGWVMRSDTVLNAIGKPSTARLSA
jgi:hypothetical protein